MGEVGVFVRPARLVRVEGRRQRSLPALLLLLLLLQAIGRAQDASAPLLRVGLELAASGRYAEAEAQLEQARIEAPDDAAVLSALGKVKARMGNTAGALPLLRQVATSQPRSAQAHLDLAVVMADAKDLPGALQQTAVAEQIAPRMAAAHWTRGRILADLHQRNAAEAEFSRAMRLDPHDAKGTFYWALLERDNADYAAAIPLLQRVVQAEPQNDEAWMLLGDSQSYVGHKAAAIASWRKALAANSNATDAVYKLWQATRASDPAGAAKLLADFHALQQNAQTLDEVKTLGNQGYVKMQTQNWADAIANFKKAIDLCGNCAVSGGLHKDLGLALCHDGRISEGQKELELALRLSPGDADIVRALAALQAQPQAVGH